MQPFDLGSNHSPHCSLQHCRLLLLLSAELPSDLVIVAPERRIVFGGLIGNIEAATAMLYSPGRSCWRRVRNGRPASSVYPDQSLLIVCLGGSGIDIQPAFAEETFWRKMFEEVDVVMLLL